MQVNYMKAIVVMVLLNVDIDFEKIKMSCTFAYRYDYKAWNLITESLQYLLYSVTVS